MPPPTGQKDPYEVLGLDRSATGEDVRKAFQKLARKWHPDVNPGNKEEAEQQFKEIAGAYEILSDPEKRRAFDQFGHAGVGAGAGGPDFGGFDFSQGFGGGGLEDLFSAFFGGAAGRGGRRGGPQPGADLQTVVNLSLSDVMEGTQKDIRYSRDVTCDTCKGSGAKAGTSPTSCTECQGTGQVTFSKGGILRISQPCPKCQGRGTLITDPCVTCKGRGVTAKEETITVKIPPGVSTNTQIRLDGRGEAGSMGGPAGDLYVITRVQEHAVFQRRGDNLYVEVPISFTEAALGAKIEVPAIKEAGGSTKLTIPPGTQTNTQFRVRGYGVPHLNGRGTGDQYVIVQVHTPRNLSSREKTLLKDLGDASGEKPREQLLKVAKGK
jgi:molecular chaperone DnaJ